MKTNSDTLQQRYKESSRRGSAIQIESNPFDKIIRPSAKNELKVDNLSDCKPIKPEEFALLLMKLLDADE
jgi:hypothetical protein